MAFRAIAFAFLTFIFGGCASYNAFDMFKKDEFYERALVVTKNAQIISSFETKAKISATHLNSLYPERYSDADYFFVGVYIPDDYDKSQSAGLFNKEYVLSVKRHDGFVAPLKIEEIVKKEESELYKKMPHVDSWSRYYVVSFPKDEKGSAVVLSFRGAGGEALLSFSKAP